ncbi:TPA: NGO1622 family putative holin [Neisseria cinerea]
MKAGNIVFKLAVLLAVLAAGYAFGFSRGGGAAKEKPADIAAMRMALAQKQAQVAELSAEIWLEERHLSAEEEADYRWIHGDAEVPEGKE